MKAKQVAVIEISKGGSDCGLYLDGHHVLAADPVEGDSAEVVNEVADTLARIAGLEVTRLAFDANGDEWQWDEVEMELKADGLLVSVE